MKLSQSLAFWGMLFLPFFSCQKEDKQIVTEPEIYWQKAFSNNDMVNLVFADQDRLYSFAETSGELIARNKSDGNQIWKTSFLGRSSGFFSGDIFVQQKYQQEAGNFLKGIDLLSGQIIWEKQFPNTAEFQLEYLFGDNYLMQSEENGFQQLDARTGDLQPLGNILFSDNYQNSGIIGTLNAQGDPIIYQLGCFSDPIPDDCSVGIWNLQTQDLVDEISLQQPSGILGNRQLAIAGNAIIVLDGDGITSYHSETLQIQWNIPEEPDEILVLGDKLLAKEFSGPIEVYDLGTGRLLFSFESFSNQLSLKTHLIGNVLYHINDGDPGGFFSSGGAAKLMAYRATDGAICWDKTLLEEQEDGLLYADPYGQAIYFFTEAALICYIPVN